MIILVRKAKGTKYGSEYIEYMMNDVVELAQDVQVGMLTSTIAKNLTDKLSSMYINSQRELRNKSDEY